METWYQNLLHNLQFSIFTAKIDCAWSQYSWGECDKKCGGGFQYGTRTIARYADGGAECEGEAQTTRSCNTDPCPGKIIK